MAYIEREALLSKFNIDDMMNVNGTLILLNDARKAIKDAPSADVAPVRHGRWIEPSRLYYGAKQYECSLCYSDTFWKKHSITVKYPHCPNCGAKMMEG